MIDRERRQSQRHAFGCRIDCMLPGSQAPSWWGSKEPVWRVSDMSAGGIGVVTNQLVDVWAPVQVRFPLAGVPVLISSLLQVRWIAEVFEHPGTYRVGLAYLT